MRSKTLEEVNAELNDLELSIGELTGLLEAKQHADTLKESFFLKDKVLPAMNNMREHADALETLVADDLWDLPTYQEMLFFK